jgi:hypothetical protein
MGKQHTGNKELMQCDPMYKNHSLQNLVLETPNDAELLCSSRIKHLMLSQQRQNLVNFLSFGILDNKKPAKPDGLRVFLFR